VPAIEAIGDHPQELRRSLRDLVAASMLPAVWRDYDAQQIAESVAEVLIRMLGLEFAHVSGQWERVDPIRVGRTSDRTAPDPTAALRGALGEWLKGYPSSEVVTIADPIGAGSVRVMFVPVAAGEGAVIAAASRAADFPSAAQRLLVEVTANQAAIAIRRWQAEHALTV
jgi:hypothetical protein